MQLNHIILMLVRSIKLLFSLRMDNKKATESGFFFYWLNKLACVSFSSIS